MKEYKLINNIKVKCPKCGDELKIIYVYSNWVKGYCPKCKIYYEKAIKNG